jgi:hypothetical protein
MRRELNDLMPQESSDPTIAMIGGGFYSANALGAKDVIDATKPLVDEALRALIPIPSDKPFAIADFGASDGGTSADLMRHIVGTVRTTLPDRAITLTYTDLPYNDFSTLFRRVHGILDVDDPQPLGQESGLFTFASGTSLHRQIFPDETLSFGFSASAMHYLSVKPGLIADHVHAVGATDEEKASYRDLASSDWTAILLARARELVPGGRLVLANFCVDEHGHHLGSTGGVNVFDALSERWRSLASTGLISEDEYRAATFQQYYKTVPEFVVPFQTDSSVTRAGLRLDHVSTMLTPCPFAAMFRQSGDATAYARAYVPSVRSWANSTFMGALDPARPQAERIAIVDQLFEAYEAEVAAAPELHWKDYVHCIQSISKPIAFR